MCGGESPALKIDTGELFVCAEKFVFLEVSDGRGGEIRTPDPLLPKQDWQFFQCRLQWWWV